MWQTCLMYYCIPAFPWQPQEVLSGHKATLQISDMEWNEVKLLAFTSQLC